jgi:uncharacterized membrane protein
MQILQRIFIRNRNIAVGISDFLLFIIFFGFLFGMPIGVDARSAQSAQAQAQSIQSAQPQAQPQPQSQSQDQVTVLRAGVTKVDSTTQQIIAGTGTSETVQQIEAVILQGPGEGTHVVLENDLVPLSAGEQFFLAQDISAGQPSIDGQPAIPAGQITYSVYDVYRLNVLYALAALFLLLVVIFGGYQGMRGLVSLGGSLVLILYALIPGILHGWSPIVVSLGVASLIIVLGSYVTHGFKRATTAAVVGMIATVVLTAALAEISVHAAHLTGLASDEAVSLNFASNGTINIVGLLLGGMLIGVLGVLYDAAIGQAIAVEELHHVAPHLPRRAIFTRALRIGREHIGALVNTLAIAYVGVSLPLLLLLAEPSVSSAVFGGSSLTFLQIINKENFATEIIRALVGSIGLVLAVPITTLLAVWILVKVRDGRRERGSSNSMNVANKKMPTRETIEKEEYDLEKYEHHHLKK